MPRLEALATALPGTTFELLVVGGPAPAIRGMRTIFWPWSETNEREHKADQIAGYLAQKRIVLLAWGDVQKLGFAVGHGAVPIK